MTYSGYGAKALSPPDDVAPSFDMEALEDEAAVRLEALMFVRRTETTRMNLGKEVRELEVEPIEWPARVPQREREPAREPEPVETER